MTISCFPGAPLQVPHDFNNGGPKVSSENTISIHVDPVGGILMDHASGSRTHCWKLPLVPMGSSLPASGGSLNAPLGCIHTVSE